MNKELVDNYEKPEVAGNLFGFDIKHRGKYILNGKEHQHGALLTLCIEDDEFWHRKDQVQFDEFWLDDMIKVCEKAKAHLKAMKNE